MNRDDFLNGIDRERFHASDLFDDIEALESSTGSSDALEDIMREYASGRNLTELPDEEAPVIQPEWFAPEKADAASAAEGFAGFDDAAKTPELPEMPEIAEDIPDALPDAAFTEPLPFQDEPETPAESTMDFSSAPNFDPLEEETARADLDADAQAAPSLDDLFYDPEAEEDEFSDDLDALQDDAYSGSTQLADLVRDSERTEAVDMFSEEDAADEAEDEEDYADEDLEEQPIRPQRRRKKKRHPVLSAIGHALLVFVAALCAFYLVMVYSNFSAVKNLRTTYIRTAMSTYSHKWLATAFFPNDVIRDVMRNQYQSLEGMEGITTTWGTVSVEKLPTFSVVEAPEEDSAAESYSVEPIDESEEATRIQTKEEQTFFEIFWELDQDSVYAYMEQHPEALSSGWSGIDINASALDDTGTSMQTIYGDQVLALNAVDGVMLARVYLSSNRSRGVLAICKDTSRLSLCPASNLGTIGETAGTICENNGGVLAITGSAFDDPEGDGNGGAIDGLAVCSGTVYGERMGVSYKRLELRYDDKMYIVDSTAALNSETRDACEFQPALIIDGNVLVDDYWTELNPRAAMGQSSRLETMMIVVEGRYTDSMGCSVEYVAEKLHEYGCVQAMNLDGGTSAMMYYKGNCLIRCSNPANPEGRTLPTAWVYKAA